MDFLANIVDFVLHIDVHLSELIEDFGMWIYLILFLVITGETGLVIAPLLPGDSLLFAAGTFAALGALDVALLFVLLFGAAVLGDTINYWIGHAIGPRVFTMNSRWFKREYLERTHRFYERHGGKTIFLARFVPIIRTFAPFVAGVGAMTYGRFLTYNVVGGFVWTAGFLFLGYFFGNIPVVKENFSLVVLAIILISLAPMGYELLASRLRRGREEPQGGSATPGEPTGA